MSTSLSALLDLPVQYIASRQSHHTIPHQPATTGLAAAGTLTWDNIAPPLAAPGLASPAAARGAAPYGPGPAWAVPYTHAGGNPFLQPPAEVGDGLGPGAAPGGGAGGLQASPGPASVAASTTSVAALALGGGVLLADPR